MAEQETACACGATRHRAFEAMSDAVLAIAAARSAEPVLQRLVEAARELAGARYAALGIPDGAGGFAQFLTTGISEEQMLAIGPLPRTHGLLGATLDEVESFRTDDITADPRYQGWPSAHPDMRSFLGVPILSKGAVIGALYLTEKVGGGGFTDADQQLIELLAAHAAVAIDNARLWDASRELAMVEERTRMARELHDAMTQKLFSLTLTAEAAADTVRADPEAARAHLATIGQLAHDTLAELRALIVGLRPADLEADGLAGALRKQTEVLARAHGVDIALEVDDDERWVEPHVEQEVFRIAQEALHNALRHSRARQIAVQLRIAGGGIGLTVADDGVGFDPSSRRLRATRLGLTSMRERARALGGRLAVESSPGAGTAVRMEVPLG